MGKEKDKVKAAVCPICKEQTVQDYRPFCSKRCADIDLGRWFNEDYAVPAVEPPDEWDLDLPDGEGEGDDDPTDKTGKGYLH